MDSEFLGIIVGLAIGVAVAVFLALRLIRRMRIAKDKRTKKK